MVCYALFSVLVLCALGIELFGTVAFVDDGRAAMYFPNEGECQRHYLRDLATVREELEDGISAPCINEGQKVSVAVP